jgi:RNA-directed DNA polymerase
LRRGNNSSKRVGKGVTVVIRWDENEIRFADDAILCFHYREDAEKVKSVLSKRFAK